MITKEQQIERFKSGFPWMKIVAPATPGHGIEVLSEKEAEEAVEYLRKAEVHGKAKFVPASGAASRMFKDLFAGLEASNDKSAKFAEQIKKFAFYTPELFPEGAGEKQMLEAILLDRVEETGAEGLGYGSKPKGVLKFHRYASGEIRTALAEHLVEAQQYMRNADNSVNLTVTISPEHRPLFEAALADIKEEFEARYGVKYIVEFVYQDKETDTYAVDPENRIFLKEDGTELRRPAGHGALIYNLDKMDCELVSIKNIDNVSHERFLPVTAHWKEVLMGRALELRDTIFAYLRELDAVSTDYAGRAMENFPVIPGYNNTVGAAPCTSEACQLLCNDIEDFLREKLCTEIPACETCAERVEELRKKLNRPIRVCGMVKNEGEPGGGPFIIKEKDGSTGLQILEGAQINKDDAHAVDCLKNATHFNPVDLVCCLKDYEGNAFNLLDYVDEDAGFISSKSYQGRELKALELPGLWNGAMSKWNTLFVEVPIETFNPVKTVLDLLRPAHQEQ